jgi:hypothetical protein
VGISGCQKKKALTEDVQVRPTPSRRALTEDVPDLVLGQRVGALLLQYGLQVQLCGQKNSPYKVREVD